MATILTQPAAPTVSTARNGLRDFWARLRRSKMGLVGLVMLLAVVGMAVFAPLIAPTNPYKPVRARIDTIYAPPSAEHPFGTDDGGKDVLSSFIYGSRVSLIVGFTASVIAVALGGLVGMIAGFYGMRLGGGLMRIRDMFLVIADLLL